MQCHPMVHHLSGASHVDVSAVGTLTSPTRVLEILSVDTGVCGDEAIPLS